MRPDWRKNTRLARGLVLLLLLPCMACQLTETLEDILAGDQDKSREIAARLEVAPSWRAIVAYMEQSFTPGKSREEIFDVVAKIGPYETTETKTAHGCVVNVHFTDPVTRKHIEGYSFSFDEQGRLKAAAYLDFPWLDR